MAQWAASLGFDLAAKRCVEGHYAKNRFAAAAQSR